MCNALRQQKVARAATKRSQISNSARKAKWQPPKFFSVWDSSRKILLNLDRLLILLQSGYFLKIPGHI